MGNVQQAAGAPAMLGGLPQQAPQGIMPGMTPYAGGGGQMVPYGGSAGGGMFGRSDLEKYWSGAGAENIKDVDLLMKSLPVQFTGEQFRQAAGSLSPQIRGAKSRSALDAALAQIGSAPTPQPGAPPAYTNIYQPQTPMFDLTNPQMRQAQAVNALGLYPSMMQTVLPLFNLASTLYTRPQPQMPQFPQFNLSGLGGLLGRLFSGGGGQPPGGFGGQGGADQHWVGPPQWNQ